MGTKQKQKGYVRRSWTHRACRWQRPLQLQLGCLGWRWSPWQLPCWPPWKHRKSTRWPCHRHLEELVGNREDRLEYNIQFAASLTVCILNEKFVVGWFD